MIERQAGASACDGELTEACELRLRQPGQGCGAQLCCRRHFAIRIGFRPPTRMLLTGC